MTPAELLESQPHLLLARYKALLAELMRVNGERNEL